MPQGVILPRLSTLEAAAWEARHPAMETLFGPQLRSVTLNIPSDCTSSTACLSYLPRFSPQVTYLDLGVLDQVVVDKLGETLSLFRQLRTLVLESRSSYEQRPYMSNAFCNAASALPVLRQLYTACRLPEEPKMHWERPDPTSIPFPALEVLEFYDYDRGSIRSCSLFLRIFRPVELSAFSLRLSGTARTNSDVFSLGDSDALIRTVHEIIPHPQLVEFGLASPGAGIAPITLDILRLLFSFGHLRKVTLQRCLNVDDSAFEEMATAWPSLQELHTSNCWIPGSTRSTGMWGRSPSPNRDEHTYWSDRELGDPSFSSPTLQALAHLVQHCRKLVQLFIEVVVSKAEALQLDTQLAGGNTNGRVWKLELGRSFLGFAGTPGTTMFHVSTFLLDIFPNLTDIVIDEEGPTPKEWKQVQEIVRGLSVFGARLVRSTS